MRKLAKGLGFIFAAVLVIIVVAVGASGVARAQTRQLPAATGPSAVGRVELVLTDAARVDPFVGDGSPRELVVWIWYPTAKGNTAPTAPYLPKAWADAQNGTNGPAGGGGFREAAYERIGVVSTLLERARVRPAVTVLEKDRETQAA